MKLNQDCIRDLLLYLEETLTLEEHVCIDCDIDDSFLPNHSIDDVRYVTLKLIEAGYLNAKTQYFIGSSIPSIRISSITWEGHKFLDNIRDNVVWKNTKSILSKFTSTSIGIVSDIASQVISKLISQQLNLP